MRPPNLVLSRRHTITERWKELSRRLVNQTSIIWNQFESNTQSTFQFFYTTDKNRLLLRFVCLYFCQPKSVTDWELLIMLIFLALLGVFWLLLRYYNPRSLTQAFVYDASNTQFWKTNKTNRVKSLVKSWRISNVFGSNNLTHFAF